ncbi:GntR family transcriptional regulator [Amycolatopsis sp.]|uniref:GntR family transcriptional regulator n=1 Tax=Amycolatopsis sp. TaxID=37632 RepID=UPI002C010CDB|nr:GntR family transcriptional regulator [Amycolatopsis sp.]HVV13662.1 GntR family transcriptional regulator [Amycolatopsis sp.]
MRSSEVDIAESLSAQVYTTLRERIITGTYPQGSRLPEQKLAIDLSVSRIPLREAIQQLEVDGLAQSLPRRGAIVWTWTTQAIHDLFDVRLSLEVSAAALAARRVGAGADVTAMEEALSRQHKSLDEHSPLGIAEASTAFHQAVMRTTGNELLTSLGGAVTSRMVWLFYLTSGRDQELACQEHHELFDAICSGNERVAEAVAYAHIERGRIPTLQAFPELT